MEVEAKRSYEGLEQLRNPNRLSDHKPVALVCCLLRSIENENSRDWTTKKVAKSIKQCTQLGVFSGLSMLGMIELGQRSLHPNARIWREVVQESQEVWVTTVTHLASIPTTMV
jgi:hypothetical protein